jgi:hypothetical protein
MTIASMLRVSVLCLALGSPVLATTYGSVEPIATSDVVDTGLLRQQRLEVRAAFAHRLLQCGIVDEVLDVLRSNKSIRTINGLNVHVEVGAGGFAGATNPSFVYTVLDSGPNAATHEDVRIATDSLGYVLSQGSAFLLDAANASSFDFPANYVVLNFDTPPSLRKSAALFETVGTIDPELFATDSSGYTQYGRAYLSLQSLVEDDRFIAGYVQAAARFGVEYTPVVGGAASLFTGGAAFPGNNWILYPRGEEYLSRIPAANHQELRRLRNGHLRFTREALRALAGEDDDQSRDREGGGEGARHRMGRLRCPE